MQHEIVKTDENHRRSRGPANGDMIIIEQSSDSVSALKDGVKKFANGIFSSHFLLFS